MDSKPDLTAEWDTPGRELRADIREMRDELRHERVLFRKDLEIFAAKVTFRLITVGVLSFVALYFIVRLTERV